MKEIEVYIEDNLAICILQISVQFVALVKFYLDVFRPLNCCKSMTCVRLYTAYWCFTISAHEALCRLQLMCVWDLVCVCSYREIFILITVDGDSSIIAALLSFPFLEGKFLLFPCFSMLINSPLW